MNADRNRVVSVCFAIIALCAITSFAQQTEVAQPRELLGRVVVRGGSEPVAGAAVTIVELDRRTTTDADGVFRFDGVPRGEFTVGVHASTFGAVHVRVTAPQDGDLVLELAPDHHFEEEITVTARPWVSSPLESPQAVDQVGQDQLRAVGDSSVGDALQRIPGVANIGTGDALGTPVIRGTSENRTRVLNGGVPTNFQQWSFRHSPNIEPQMAERIEVVRGPASVLWGPDAMGGVVNVVRPPLPSAPAGESVVHGDVGVAWHGNNDQLQGSATVEGGYGGFGWRLGLVSRDTGDIDTPDGELENTDYEQTNFDAAVGLSGTWGSAQLRWNHWDNDVGFYFPPGHPSDGFRLDLEDDFLAAEATLPTAVGDVGLLLSRQENLRKAFNPAAPVYPDAAVDLRLETVVARASFAHTPMGAFQGTVAAELQTVENETLASNLLPDYDSSNFSIMILEEARFLAAKDGGYKRFIVSAGLRWDDTELEVPVDPGQPVVPEGFNQDYNHVTGSLGVVFRATEQLSFAANLGRGWRPPNAFELFARGIHGGIAAFQVGNPNLEEESNLSSELSVRYLSAHWRAVVTGFRSDFEDFIYLYDTGETINELPIFGFGQTDAVLDGIEASVEVVPIEHLELGFVYSSVNTENEATGESLPQSPPDRVNLTVRGMTEAIGVLLSPYVELEGVWMDDGVPSGPDEPYYATGNAGTDSYQLIHLRAGFRLPVAKGAVRFDLTVRNLFDESYTDFLYPYKGFGVLNPGRDIRLIAGYSF